MFRRYREKAVFYEVSLEKELEDIDYMPEIEKMRIVGFMRSTWFFL